MKHYFRIPYKTFVAFVFVNKFVYVLSGYRSIAARSMRRISAYSSDCRPGMKTGQRNCCYDWEQYWNPVHSLLTTPVYSRTSWSRRFVTLRHRSRALKMDMLSPKAFVIISILSEGLRVSKRKKVEVSVMVDWRKTLLEKANFLDFGHVTHLASEYFQLTGIPLCKDISQRRVVAKFDHILNIILRIFVCLCVEWF